MASDSRKAHLGVGWAFPVRPVNGRLRFARYEDAVEQAIRVVLLTVQGERVMLPEFGAGLRQFVFEPNSPSTRARLADTVKRALVDWEPRIELERVEVTPGADDHVALIHVDYVVRATNQFYNRVYPFYLLEGRA